MILLLFLCLKGAGINVSGSLSRPPLCWMLLTQTHSNELTPWFVEGTYTSRRQYLPGLVRRGGCKKNRPSYLRHEM